MRPFISRRRAIALLAAISAIALPSLASALELYRDVGRIQPPPVGQQATYANLAPEQFNYNNELSLMTAGNNPPHPKFCKFRLTVTLANPGDDHGPVTGLGNGNNYIATRDPHNPAHWLVARPAGVTTAAAGQATSQYALANRGRVANGTANNCN